MEWLKSCIKEMFLWFELIKIVSEYRRGSSTILLQWVVKIERIGIFSFIC